MTPEQRRLSARAASHASWAKTVDRTERTSHGTKKFLDRFEKQVDPDGTLPTAERAKRAASARQAYFLNLALKSSQARAQRKSA